MPRPVVLAFALLFVSPACKKSAVESEPQGAEISAPVVADVERVTEQNLLALAHLADVHDTQGLRIDFGTAARFKYTNGNWQSGWFDDRREGEATVSTFRSKAKVFLPSAERAPTKWRARVKPYAKGTFTVLLNGKKLTTVDVEPGELRELVAEIPAGAYKPGENEIELRASGFAKVGEERLSAAVDWMRIDDGPPSKDREAGVTEIDPSATLGVGGVERPGLRLERGMYLDWFVEVPDGAVLELGLGSPEADDGGLSVGVRSDRDARQHRVPAEGQWTQKTLPLSDFGGEVVRIRVLNDGASAAAVSDLRLERPARAPAQEPAKAEARNVVLILVDTLRASKLQLYYPESRVTTPVIDELAKEGTLFDRAQAPENWTKPSVASVLTSLYPTSHLAQADAAKLSESVTMISEVYRDAGFTTASFVTNSFVSPEFGFDQGWDLNVNMDYLADSNEGKAENVFAAAGDWLAKHEDERFFLYIQTIDPHAPYDPPGNYLQQYDSKPYDGQVENQKTAALLMQVNNGTVKLTERDAQRLEALHDGEITYHDVELGKFLGKMKELGLDENTIVVLTSDHGEEFGEHGKWGHGHSMYQELLHVPLVFRWPGVVPGNQRVGAPVSIVDIGPTLFDAAGVTTPTDMEGNSLMSFLVSDGRRGPHAAFSEWLELYRTVRTAHWKLVLHAFFAPELYDLKNDPWEKNKLSAKDKPVAQRYLRTLLGQFLGAPDRKTWLAPTVTGPASAADEREVEKQEMTPELCRQLVALGYLIAECE